MRQLILLLLNFVSCLYEDQIGKFDWRKELIGVPLFVAFDVSKGPTKYVSVYSERNVSFLKKISLQDQGFAGRHRPHRPGSLKLQIPSFPSSPGTRMFKIHAGENVDVLRRPARDLIS